MILASIAALLLCCMPATVSGAPQPIDTEARQWLPKSISLPLTSSVDVDPALHGAKGAQEIIVRLKSPPAAMIANDMSQTEITEHKAMLVDEQTQFMKRTGTSSKEITCVQTLLNAVFLTIDAEEALSLAEDPFVVSIHRVGHFEKQLSETVPYIGATQVQNEGYDGTGIKVAVMDSGIDYTHAALGGEGTAAAFEAAYKNNTSRDNLFPTKKVVEGYDFVGEIWPDGPLVPNEDPIDIDGHGTAVADIISAVAPGASLYAVKVCSAISSACNGIALIQGMEYAVDPNGDGDTSDAVDVINLSLGSSYQPPFDDDLSAACEAASALGVVVVAAAGNSGNKLYIQGSPASARSVISVAQTQVPSASLQILTVAEAGYIAIFQPWSAPLDQVISGPLQYGDGQGGNLDGCGDFAEGSLAGKIVLVDRGTCNFTLKISMITLGGGLAGIIGLIAPGAPFPSSDGGDRPVDVPGFMVSQADANAMKAAPPDSIAVLDPEDQLPLVMQMAGSSSRGPQNQATTLIKPEIGAPGASVAAVAGTGTGTAAFGGTSGASPMVAGAAALLLQAYPHLAPAEVKARLMNNGETNIDTDPFEGLAPITRIGGGETRVDKALSARAAAWDEETLQGALSFGFVDVVQKTHILFKKFRIRNYSDDDITFSITPTFRYAEDEDSGAVAISTVFPGKVLVGAKEDRLVSVALNIRGDRLPGNYMSSGTDGANAASLTLNEYDGYMILDDGVQPIHLPWHVLPRRSANVTVENDILDFVNDVATVDIGNTGMGDANVDVFSLVAVSPNLPEGLPGERMPRPDIRAVGVNTVRVGPDVCSDSSSFIWQFAISTWERHQHLFPVFLVVNLDIDQDGTDDFALVNSDFSGVPPSGSSLDGRQVAFSIELESFFSDAFFFVQHAMNSGNVVLNVCAEQLGLSETDLMSTKIDITVTAESLFYSSDPGDTTTKLTLTPGGERYVASTTDLIIGPGQNGTVAVEDRGRVEDNSDELGIMILADGDRGEGNRGGATQESELILLRV